MQTNQDTRPADQGENQRGPNAGSATFAALEDLQPTDWRDLVGGLATLALSGRIASQQALAGRDDIESAVTAFFIDAVEAAARLGFGLAKSWPADVADLDNWTARAWEFAQLDRFLAERSGRGAR